jgi:hypothetical protein
MLLTINGHVSLHGCEDTGFEIWWVKLRIRLEVKEDFASLLSFNVPDEGIRQDVKQLCRLLVIVLATFVLFVLGAWVVDEGSHFLTLLLVGKRLSIPLDDSIQTH